MAKLENLNVLLSPVSETEDGLTAINFYAEPVGFGKVSEMHERDQRLGNVAVMFSDLEDGPGGVAFAINPELLNNPTYVKELIAYGIRHYN